MTFLIPIIIVFSGIFHGISGSGFPIIATILVSSILPFKESVFLLIMPTLAVNVFSCIIGRFNPLKLETTYWLLTISCLLGSFVSVYLLVIINPNIFKIILSLTIIFSLLNSDKYTIHSSFFNSILFGFIAGCIGGATNSISIILMIYLMSVEKDKYKIFVTANLCFIMGKIPQILILKNNISVDINIMYLFIIVLLSVFSVYIGFKIFKLINYNMFKKITRVVMLVLAIVIGIQGAVSLLLF
jgi:hypothetical protein